MNKLDYLGGALENFYEEDMENPHLTPRVITVVDDGKTIAHGTAAEIKDNLKDKYDRNILAWDAYFHFVLLLTEFCRLNDIDIPDSGYFGNNEYEEKFRKFVLENVYLPAVKKGKEI